MTQLAKNMRRPDTSGPASAAVEAVLARIAALDGDLNCFTAILADRARDTACRIDVRLARGEEVGSLAGMPFAVKNLFDVAGMVTLAGAKIERDSAPAKADADAITALEAAGAILIGTLNMDEYAYGFSTENEHFGPTRNPHDRDRIAGGSSGGSAAAVAAGIVPLTLGSDTNGSVRIPAALCGVFGMKPTFDRLSRRGCFPFVDSFDHVGLFAGDAATLAAAFSALDGDASAVAQDVVPLRAAMLGGWFRAFASAEVLSALDHVARELGDLPTVELPHSEIARSAAFCITAAEGGARHLANLAVRSEDFDRTTRDRLIAGALLPAAAVAAAQRFRAWYRAQAAALFGQYDILIAPTTFCTAPRIGEATVRIGDADIPVRANLGLYTQPLSFIGLPVVSVPILEREGLPIGLQIVGRAGCDAEILRFAAMVESTGLAGRIALPAPSLSNGRS